MNIDNLFQVGFNHLLAPVGCREKAAAPEAQLPQALTELAADLGIHEVVLLSTCSLMELYGVCQFP